MDAATALLNALVASSYDLTGDGRIGNDNERCRDSIASGLVPGVLEHLEKAGWRLEKVAPDLGAKR